MLIRSTRVWKHGEQTFVSFVAPGWDQDAFHGRYARGNRAFVAGWAKRAGYTVANYDFYESYIALPDDLAVLCHLRFSAGIEIPEINFS